MHCVIPAVEKPLSAVVKVVELLRSAITLEYTPVIRRTTHRNLILEQFAS